MHIVKHKDITGRTFGRLTVIRRLPNRGKRIFYECECVCGNRKPVSRAHLAKGAVVTCGCGRFRRGPDHPCWLGYGEISGHIWDQIRRSGEQSSKRYRKGHNLDITIKEAWDIFILQNRCCKLTGIELNFGEGCKGKGRTASLDRIDSSKGYSIDNVQWLHKDINWMKNTFPQEYFIQMCQMVSDHTRRV